jgi:cytochrome P450
VSETDLYYDPFDYEIDANPHPMWKRMRDEAPLYRNERHDFFALSRFQDVLGAHLDPETFISGQGTVLEMMGKIPQPPPMIFMDPPEHTRLRKLVSRAFSPRRIAALEPRIRGLCKEYLDPQVGSGGFDYVEDFGAILPVMVISSLLGIPEEDQHQVRLWTDAMLHREEGETGVPDSVRQVQAELFGYFARYAQERRKRPRDDMMSDLLQAEVPLEDGGSRKLSEVEILVFVGLLSAAGNETVARLLGWVAILLARNPDERRKLLADPSLVPGAVEELLRYEAPSPVQARQVARDTTLHGEHVPEGSTLLLLTGSAGRDEREYPDADRFDVTRRFERHVSLGYGVHFCLGASLARMEGRMAIEETLARFPNWEIDEDGLEMIHTSTVRGYEKVPIRF